jgi:hypothetical protein
VAIGIAQRLAPESAWLGLAADLAATDDRLRYPDRVRLRPELLIDNEHATIVDVEPMPARTHEVRATSTMADRAKAGLVLKPKHLAG